MKVGLYARVSSERQEKEQTIKSQLAELREFCKNHKHEIVDEFIDDGYSGELLARPELDRMRDDAERGRFEKVLILDPDRLSRKYAYQVLLLEEFEKRNIGIEFLNHKIGESPEDALFLQIQGAVAEYEKAKLIERSRRGRLAQAKSGKLIGNRSPYGYIYKKGTPKEERMYKINQEEAEGVKRIFELYLEHGSIKEVSKVMTHKERFIPRASNIWRTSTIERILKNESYIGTTYYNKHKHIEDKNAKGYKRNKNSKLVRRDRSEWIAIKIPAIIDNSMFAKAQEILKRNFKPFYRETKNKYLLSGLMKCVCGSRFNGEFCYGKKYYRCTNRTKRHPLLRTCNAGSVRAERLEDATWNAFSKAMTTPRLLLEYAGFKAKEEEIKRSKEQGFLQELKDLERKLNKEISRRDRLVEVYRDGDVDKETYKLKMELSHNDIEKLKTEKSEKEKILTQAKNIPLAKEVIKKFAELMELKIRNLGFEQRRAMLRYFVNEVVFDKAQNELTIKGNIPSQHPETILTDLSKQIEAITLSDREKSITPLNCGTYPANAGIVFEMVVNVK